MTHYNIFYECGNCLSTIIVEHDTGRVVPVKEVGCYLCRVLMALTSKNVTHHCDNNGKVGLCKICAIKPQIPS